MNTSENAIHSPSSPVDSLLLVLREIVKAPIALNAIFERASQRRKLLTLSEHLLKDIGINRAQAELEAAKPFWRN